MNTTTERPNLNELTQAEKNNLAKSTYDNNSYFQQLFQQDTVEIEIGDLAQAFRQEIMRILLQKDLVREPIELEQLHNYLSDEMRAYNFDDGVNKISTFFYETDNEIMQVYYRFIRLLRMNFVKEPFWFQKTPTIRLHCPNSKNNHHYPRYHTDVGYGHPPEEINIWIPFTKHVKEHGFRVMDVEHSKQILEQFNFNYSDFIHSAIHDKAFSHACDQLAKPVTTELGKMFAFDSRCVHTGEPLTAHSRVSMDVRILPLSQYDKMQITYQGSGRRKIIFAPGHCYHEQDSDSFLNV